MISELMTIASLRDLTSAFDITRPNLSAVPARCEEAKLRQIVRRAKILAAARSLFADGGPHSPTMRELAARSGSTVPTIYSVVGNRSAVLEQALLEHLHTCIAIAPLIADREGVNVINGFGDALWLSAQLEPAYLRRQILLARHDLDGRRIGALLVQNTTAAMRIWVSDLCVRSRLAKRIGHEEIASAIEAQMRTALLDWAEGHDSASKVRYKLARAPAICLSRFIDEQTMARLSNWLSGLA